MEENIEPASNFGKIDDEKKSVVQILENNKTSETDSINIEFNETKNPYQIKSDEISILTRITQIHSQDDDNDDAEPICLDFYTESNSQLLIDDAFEFVPNEDPGIDEYMSKVEDDDVTGWERYTKECHKFSLPRISKLKNCVDGTSKILDLSDYIPQSIGTVLALEILCEEPIKELTHIDLHNSPFTESGCHSLNEFLENTLTLEYLNLANCRIGWAAIKVLEDGLNANQSLTYLNLSGCNIQDEGGIIVAKAFATNEICKEIILSHNSLYVESAIALGDMFKSNNKLDILDLKWNNLASETGLKHFFKGLKDNKNLKDLNLSFNGFSGKEIAAIMNSGLSKNKALEVLNLENNRLTGTSDEIVDAICKSKLKEVYLGYNSWTEKDYGSIINICSESPTVQYLSLGKETWITIEIGKLVKTILEKKPDLKIIYKGILRSIPASEVDGKGIFADRIRILAMKPKKAKFRKNIGHFFLQLLEMDKDMCSAGEFIEKALEFGAVVQEGFYREMADEWTIKVGKAKKVKIREMAEHYLNRYPTEPPEALPPPPPSRRQRT